MSYHINYDHDTAIDKIVKVTDANYDVEHEKRMIMYRILSEVERISEEKGMNRKELAGLIGTSASYITQLFRGNKIINLETIAKIQKALDIKFEIKANQNNFEEEIGNLDLKLEQFCENQEDMHGYWAFRSFKPVYKKEKYNIGSPENKYLSVA